MGQITLRWVEGHLMVAGDTNGHSIVIGRSPEGYHPWVGVKPSDLLLMAVAACCTWDVVEILAKQRQSLESLKVTCSGEQRPDPPSMFTRIHVHFEVRGAVSPEKLKKAIALSEERYCSVISTLRPGVPITCDSVIL